MSDLLVCPQGTFQLTRCPENKKQGLRAWDAGDEYLLNELEEKQLLTGTKKILIVNDSFGALSVALAADHQLSLWTDSFVSWQCTEKNRLQNKLSLKNIELIKSTERPKGKFDVVLMKLPKKHTYLEEQLTILSSVLSREVVFIGAAMVKSLHTSTLKIFEKVLGPTTTSLAKKKARLIYINSANREVIKEKSFIHKYELDETKYQLINYSNVFSGQKLDIGTRFFLQHLPSAARYKTIVDMGCGNGAVGLMAAERNPDSEIVFTDESFMAVQSAKESYAASHLANPAEFYVTNGLEELASDSVELILNNPPFHQQHAVGTQVAMQMFQDAKRVLKPGGELWVIGNRHLGYHLSLKQLFGQCELVASNNKFVILKTIKKNH